MRIFGIDPGSIRTGYGCVESDGVRHRLLAYGAIAPPAKVALPDRLRAIHDGLADLIRQCSPDCVVIESLFHARNVRSALVLSHARGVAMLAVAEASLPVVEYSPAEIKLAVTGYGRAEKSQLQHMVTLLLGLETAPMPHDASDALAIAICHAHAGSAPISADRRAPLRLRSWRHAKLPAPTRRQAP